jgi:hypothetical protein
MLLTRPLLGFVTDWISVRHWTYRWILAVLYIIWFSIVSILAIIFENIMVWWIFIMLIFYPEGVPNYYHTKEFVTEKSLRINLNKEGILMSISDMESDIPSLRTGMIPGGYGKYGGKMPSGEQLKTRKRLRRECPSAITSTLPQPAGQLSAGVKKEILEKLAS